MSAGCLQSNAKTRPFCRRGRGQTRHRFLIHLYHRSRFWVWRHRRDGAAGHYDITIPNLGGFQYQYQSASFDLRPGQQAFVRIVLIRGNNSKPWQYWSGFGALLVPEQLAQAEVVPTLVADGGQR
jgi:hypothetical protein